MLTPHGIKGVGKLAEIQSKMRVAWWITFVTIRGWNCLVLNRFKSDQNLGFSCHENFYLINLNASKLYLENWRHKWIKSMRIKTLKGRDKVSLSLWTSNFKCASMNYWRRQSKEENSNFTSRFSGYTRGFSFRFSQRGNRFSRWVLQTFFPP